MLNLFFGFFVLFECAIRERANMTTSQIIQMCAAGKVGKSNMHLPPLVVRAATAALRRLSIRYVFALFEADGVLAGLAKALKCMVVTKDSDFFVYDLPSGYIPFDTLRVTKSDPENLATCVLFI
jgi:hypothetical protein